MRPLGFPRGWINAISISIAFCLDVLIKKENITSQECKTKKTFEIILHVGQVTSLQSWVAKKSCHCQTLINECSIFDYPTLKACNSPSCNIISKGFLFSIPQKLYFHFWSKSQGKSNWNRNCIFSSPWESQGSHIGSFLLCFTYPP